MLQLTITTFVTTFDFSLPFAKLPLARIFIVRLNRDLTVWSLVSSAHARNIGSLIVVLY
jgi:hypothetical protein